MEELQADLSGHIDNGLLLKVFRLRTMAFQSKITRC